MGGGSCEDLWRCPLFIFLGFYITVPSNKDLSVLWCFHVALLKALGSCEWRSHAQNPGMCASEILLCGSPVSAMKNATV